MPGISGVKGVFFDLYGTLLTYGDMDQAWEDWFQAVYQHLLDYGLARSREELAHHLEGFFAKPYPAPTAGLSILEMRLRGLGEELGLTLSPNQLSTVAEAAVSAWQAHVSVDPNAKPLLETLTGRQTLALISNFDHPTHAHRVLQESGLNDFFDSITFSGEVGLKKPDPAIYEIALTDLRLDPGECVYVGDTEEDVEGAWSAGIPAIVIKRSTNGEVGPMLDFGVRGPARFETEKPDRPPRRWIAELTDLIPLLG